MITLFGIADGMMILHGQKIVHRDLDPANVLLTHDLEARIAHFGLSRFNKAGRPLCHTVDIGTPLCWAPEICAGLEEHHFAVVVYTCGILACSMISGFSPIEELKPLTMCPLAMKVASSARLQIPISLGNLRGRDFLRVVGVESGLIELRLRELSG
jgi:serine/threonine protein kinase